MTGGKRGHNARTQARNSRGQFAPEPHVVVVSSDSDDDLNPVTTTTAAKKVVTAEVGKRAASRGKRASCTAKNPMYCAKHGKGVMTAKGVPMLRAANKIKSDVEDKFDELRDEIKYNSKRKH